MHIWWSSPKDASQASFPLGFDGWHQCHRVMGYYFTLHWINGGTCSSLSAALLFLPASFFPLPCLMISQISLEKPLIEVSFFHVHMCAVSIETFFFFGLCFGNVWLLEPTKYCLCLLQTISIHGRPRSTSMRTVTPLHPGTWRVSLVSAPPSSSSRLPSQPIPVAWLNVTLPWTITSIMATHDPPPTSSAPLRAALLTATAAAPHGAPSTLSAWWYQCPCRPLTILSLVAPSLACTMVAHHGTAVATPRVAGTQETTVAHPPTAAVAKWTESQLISWTSLRSRCRCTEMAFTHCNTNAPLPQPQLRNSATKAPGEFATWSTRCRSSSQSRTPLKVPLKWTVLKATRTGTVPTIIITTTKATTNTANAARAKTGNLTVAESNAREVGGAQMTTWTVTAHTDLLASCRGIQWTTSATASLTRSMAI